MNPAHKTTLALLETINAPHAPQALGPYSHAVRAQGLIFVSGQLGIEPHTNTLLEGVEAQTHQILQNLRIILDACQCHIHDVVKITLYLKNMHDFARVNEIYAHYFGDHRPARTCVEISNLPREASIAIDVIACAA